MYETLLLLGVACVIAAIVGGGLKIAKVAEIPLIDSVARQSLLALAGVVLIGAAFVVPSDRDRPSNGSTATGTPTVTLSEGSGPPGASLNLGGFGFGPDETVRVRFHAQEVKVLQADANGAFGGVTIMIPATWPADGTFDVIATGEKSGRLATAPFEVSAAAIEIAPGSGKRGSKVQVTGSGFAVGERVEIELHLERLTTMPVGSDGRFSGPVTVPAGWPFTGQFDIEATGQTSQRTARAPFTVG